MDRREFGRALLAGSFALVACDQDAPQLPAPPKRVLAITEAAGFRHTSIPDAVGAIRALGIGTAAWEIVAEASTAEQVAAAITAERLRGVDLVLFANTTGNLGLTPEGRIAFYEWVRGGGTFLGIHSASDTFHGDPEYLDLLRGEFLTHGPPTTVEIFVQDRAHPACAELPESFLFFDEIYEFKNWSRSRVHVLLSLHRHPQTGEPGDFPLAWTNRFGRGRVFYSALGHFEEGFRNELHLKLLKGGMLWALGILAGDDAPGNPIR